MSLILETRHSIAEILSRQPLFRGLSEIELTQISAGCREFRVKKNEVLFHKGDTSEGMHVVVMGQMKLALPSSQGVEKIVHMCGPGTTFGEAVVFLDKPYPVSAQAMTESLVLLVTKRVLLDAMDVNAMLSRKMLASLSLRLHELLGDMESCTLRTSMQRVVCFFIQSAPADETRAFEIELQSSKQNIASQLNLAPETFSRVLGHLTDKGLIQVKGRTITVLDRQQLHSFMA
ncbi:MAG: Crp/Fnr family transcriptional regulator [Pseudomonadota bacterium]|nr:Crp/Fnr family transcriptional regulator [Pseudomonadota bacterium]